MKAMLNLCMTVHVYKEREKDKYDYTDKARHEDQYFCYVAA